MTPAPISVESARERIKVAKFDAEQGVDGLWRLAGKKEDMLAVAIVLRDYAALLQQLAELERDNATMRGADYHQVGVEQEQEIIDLEAKLAEREAEVAFARETLAKALDVGGVSDEPLRTLSIRASNALYWRDQHRQEAERAREEACANAARYLAFRGSDDGVGAADVGSNTIYRRGVWLDDELDAFLAANK